MPYLSYLFCEHCGPRNEIDIDYEGTINAYINDGKSPATINPPTLVWDYLLYYCPKCQARFKYTYRDVESRVREYFVELADKYKQYFDDREIYDTRIEGDRAPTTEVNKETLDRIHNLYSKKVE